MCAPLDLFSDSAPQSDPSELNFSKLNALEEQVCELQAAAPLPNGPLPKLNDSSQHCSFKVKLSHSSPCLSPKCCHVLKVIYLGGGGGAACYPPSFPVCFSLCFIGAASGGALAFILIWYGDLLLSCSPSSQAEAGSITSCQASHWLWSCLRVYHLRLS